MRLNRKDFPEGFIFGTGKSLVPQNWPEGSEQRSAVTDFASRYESTYGEPPDIFAGHAYDAVVILEDALRRAGEDPGPTAPPSTTSWWSTSAATTCTTSRARARRATGSARCA